MGRDYFCLIRHSSLTPHWEAADAEIKVSFDENTKLEGSSFKAWSRLVYSHISYAYCQGLPHR